MVRECATEPGGLGEVKFHLVNVGRRLVRVVTPAVETIQGESVVDERELLGIPGGGDEEIGVFYCTRIIGLGDREA